MLTQLPFYTKEFQVRGNSNGLGWRLGSTKNDNNLSMKFFNLISNTSSDLNVTSQVQDLPLATSGCERHIFKLQKFANIVVTNYCHFDEILNIPYLLCKSAAGPELYFDFTTFIKQILLTK